MAAPWQQAKANFSLLSSEKSAAADKVLQPRKVVYGLVAEKVRKKNEKNKKSREKLVYGFSVRFAIQLKIQLENQ